MSRTASSFVREDQEEGLCREGAGRGGPMQRGCGKWNIFPYATGLLSYWGIGKGVKPTSKRLATLLSS